MCIRDSMKDSHIGSYGVIGLIFYFGLFYLCLLYTSLILIEMDRKPVGMISGGTQMHLHIIDTFQGF